MSEKIPHRKNFPWKGKTRLQRKMEKALWIISTRELIRRRRRKDRSLSPRLYPIRSLIRQVPLILKRIRKKALAIRMRKSVLRLPFPFRKAFRKGWFFLCARLKKKKGPNSIPHLRMHLRNIKKIKKRKANLPRKNFDSTMSASLWKKKRPENTRRLNRLRERWIFASF